MQQEMEPHQGDKLHPTETVDLKRREAVRFIGGAIALVLVGGTILDAAYQIASPNPQSKDSRKPLDATPVKEKLQQAREKVIQAARIRLMAPGGITFLAQPVADDDILVERYKAYPLSDDANLELRARTESSPNGTIRNGILEIVLSNTSGDTNAIEFSIPPGSKPGVVTLIQDKQYSVAELLQLQQILGRVDTLNVPFIQKESALLTDLEYGESPKIDPNESLEKLFTYISSPKTVFETP